MSLNKRKKQHISKEEIESYKISKIEENKINIKISKMKNKFLYSIFQFHSKLINENYNISINTKMIEEDIIIQNNNFNQYSNFKWNKISNLNEYTTTKFKMPYILLYSQTLKYMELKEICKLLMSEKYVMHLINDNQINTQKLIYHILTGRITIFSEFFTQTSHEIICLNLYNDDDFIKFLSLYHKNMEIEILFDIETITNYLIDTINALNITLKMDYDLTNYEFLRINKIFLEDKFKNYNNSNQILNIHKEKDEINKNIIVENIEEIDIEKIGFIEINYTFITNNSDEMKIEMFNDFNNKSIIEFKDNKLIYVGKIKDKYCYYAYIFDDLNKALNFLRKYNGFKLNKTFEHINVLNDMYINNDGKKILLYCLLKNENETLNKHLLFDTGSTVCCCSEIYLKEINAQLCSISPVYTASGFIGEKKSYIVDLIIGDLNLIKNVEFLSIDREIIGMNLIKKLKLKLESGFIKELDIHTI